ncbi:hypothetical protein K7432_013336 [Basidiobolus ranarum]|uniref:SWIM-type domain-containing protein n=1 Tax=Basidiobolus ranarum TaxID=34480 RepID=A0ABR2VR01_9FUNG
MKVYDLTSENEESIEATTPRRRSARIRERSDVKVEEPRESRNPIILENSDTESSKRKKVSKNRREKVQLLQGVENGEGPTRNTSTTTLVQVKKVVEKEKRMKRFRKACSEKVQQRIERAQNQRMFLLEREVISDISQKFAVLGSTGNVYNVYIGHLPNCDCPDYVRGNLCKHILFVYLKVLQVPSTSPCIYQAALLASELKSILNSAPDLSSLANDRARKAYETHCQGGEIQDETHDSQRKPVTSDKLVWCKMQCGNNVHEDCWSHWSAAKRKSGTLVTCVYCRANWEDSKGKTKSGYLNLGEIQGITRRR